MGPRAVPVGRPAARRAEKGVVRIMQTVTKKTRQGSPGRPIPPVLDPEDVPDPAPLDGEVASDTAAPPPRERDAEGREIDGDSTGTPRKGNANLVMLWFIVPLVLVILWQLLFEGGGR